MSVLAHKNAVFLYMSVLAHSAVLCQCWRTMPCYCKCQCCHTMPCYVSAGTQCYVSAGTQCRVPFYVSDGTQCPISKSVRVTCRSSLVHTTLIFQESTSSIRCRHARLFDPEKRTTPAIAGEKVGIDSLQQSEHVFSVQTDH